MYRRALASSLVAIAAACAKGDARPTTDQSGVVADTGRAAAAIADTSPAASPAAAAALASEPGAVAAATFARQPAERAPNELGRIPVFEYHLIGDTTTTWMREVGQFRRDLETVYAAGYRPVSIAELLDRKIDLPRGYSPAVFVFDDASPSQFRYIERDGKLVVDPRSALGVWQEFARTHPGWRNRAVFCVLPAAQAGRAFFGDKGIEGQKSEWRFEKMRYLRDQGFEICNHTLYHARLDRAGSQVQEFIARGQMAIDSALPGYTVRTFALPLGMWPKTREQAWQGSWRDPKSGAEVRYRYDAVLEVAGGPTRSPHDPEFNQRSIRRIPVIGNVVERDLRHLERSGTAYVSDGDPATVARPPASVTAQHPTAAPASAAAAKSRAHGP